MGEGAGQSAAAEHRTLLPRCDLPAALACHPSIPGSPVTSPTPTATPLTYTATAQYPGILGVSVNDDISKLVVRTNKPSKSAIYYRAHDPYGGVSSDTSYTATVTASETRTIHENSPADTDVSGRVKGRPPTTARPWPTP